MSRIVASMNSNRHNTGFTLIEMLIALAMMAMIVSMVYGSYAVTTGSVQAYDHRLTYSQRATLVLRLMARQLRCAYAPPADPNRSVSTAAGGNSTQSPVDSVRPGQVLHERLRPVFQGDAQHPHGGLLSFVTTAGLSGGSGGPRGLSQVRYRLDPITNTLWLDCGPRRDRLSHTDFAQRGQPILDHVVAVDLAFHDGQRWLPKWSGTKSRQLPHAVRIDLNLLDEEGRSYHFGTTVRIFTQAAGAPMATKQTSREHQR
jgi:prepilin-type N-terminal cleavage/methylation domain-containing protein